jgi:hypothetical protein
MGAAQDQINFGIDIINRSSAPLLLTDVRVRYWYTTDDLSSDQLDCDFSQLGCGVIGSQFVAVVPPRPKANAYFDIIFLQGSGMLAPGANIGPTNVRAHNRLYNQLNEADDYSFDCSMPKVAIETQLVTAYVGGVLVWGVEPPP